ncbi:hypothetical protein ACVME8_006154 [Bradyrhizobium diazoefficiens]
MFGLEGQGNWADFSGDNISLLFPGSALVTGDRNRSRIDSFGLITGQVGYAWNSVLLYVKGGAAVVGDKFDIYAAPGTTRCWHIASLRSRHALGGHSWRRP